jgi:hypothetical protein
VVVQQQQPLADIRPEGLEAVVGETTLVVALVGKEWRGKEIEAALRLLAMLQLQILVAAAAVLVRLAELQHIMLHQVVVVQD